MAKRHIDAKAYSMGEVLRRPIFYRVPTNQRDYAWTNEEIDVLWQDLKSALEDDRGEYFLGAFVIAQSPTEPTEFEVVDGQQRLASISMMLAAIRDEWGVRNRPTKSLIPFLGLETVNHERLHPSWG